jgi:peptidyl-prolyl cis-trans isomerase C
MKSLNSVILISIAITGAAGQTTAVPPSVSDNSVVLRVGDVALTKADYEKLVMGFDRGSGAVTTGGAPQSMQSGVEVARLLALVSAAKERKIDQDATVQAQIRVRGYVLLANNLLLQLRAEMKRDEAGTRALWASEKHSYIEIRARHILIRFQGVTAKAGDKGTARIEVQAKELAASILAKVKKGADFAELAKTQSDDESTIKTGGELPAFTRGAMTAEFETVAFGLPAGGLSEPFKTQYGYHVVQVLEHRPMPFETVRAALEDIRARELFEKIATSGVQLDRSYFKK